MRKIWVIDCLYASTFFVDCLTVDSHLYTLTNFEKLNHYLIINIHCARATQKETCQ
ncbi:TPA: hypothetical protein ACHHAW_001381 [Staphylococcus aureus]